MELNVRRREETQREREDLASMIAANRRVDDDLAAAARDQHAAYRADLRGQIDYNRRQRALAQDEQARLERQQRDAELEHRRKIDYLRDKPVAQNIHPIRRGLYQSQSAGPRLSRR